MTDEDKLIEIVRLYKELNPLMQGFDSMVNRLKIIKEDLDTQHRDAYHALEELNMNAAEMAKWGKYTRRMAKDRRANKLLFELAESIQQVFIDKGREPIVSTLLSKVEVDIQNKRKDIKNKAATNGNAYMLKIDKVRELNSKLRVKL